MRKLVCLFLFSMLIISSISSQSKSSEKAPLTQEEYRQYFPAAIEDAMILPTNDIVFILPTNETDKIKQEELNTFYKDSLVGFYNCLPSRKSRIINDEEALKTDLSDVNIFTFGTATGNLWTKRFLEREKKFPIKISKNKIVADSVYRAKNLIVTAVWYNPDNYKHAVVLYIPQNLDYAKNTNYYKLSHFFIFQGNKEINVCQYYHLKKRNWSFSKTRDTSLMNEQYYSLTDPNRYDLYTKIDDEYRRYPTPDQLNYCLVTENEVAVDTIQLTDIDVNCSNIDDFYWLKPITEKYKVLMFGESHYMKYNRYILNRFFTAANTYDYYPLFIAEIPYSWSAYINYYIHLNNDAEADLFKERILLPWGLPSFEMIRNWNKLHPEKPVRIASADLEHNLALTIDSILLPYFRKIDPSLEAHKEDTVKSFLEQAGVLIEQAKQNNLVGDYPFITPAYIENVYENLKSSLPLKIYGKFSHPKFRYEVMIRNLTNEEFLGNEITNNKVIFYGGSDHFMIHRDDFLNIPFITDGEYLTKVFEPTKGQTYSIRLKTLGSSLEDSIRRINPNLRFQLEVKMLKLLKDNQIQLKEPITFSNGFPEHLKKYIFKLSYKYPNCAFRINHIDYEKIFNLNYEPRLLHSLLYDFYFDGYYDTNIYVPYSPIGY